MIGYFTAFIYGGLVGSVVFIYKNASKLTENIKNKLFPVK